MKKPRTLAQLKTDPRVKDWSDERTGWCNDGIWLYLQEGWIAPSTGLGTVHEMTVADCCEALHESYYDMDEYKSVHR